MQIFEALKKIRVGNIIHMFGTEFKLELDDLKMLEPINVKKIEYSSLNVDANLQEFVLDINDKNIGAYFYVGGVTAKKN